MTPETDRKPSIHRPLCAASTARQCEMGSTLAEFALTGLFERYPNLHIVMTEGSAFWLAGLMQFLDHYWDHRYWRMLKSRFPNSAPELKMPPSFGIKRQAHATFMYDPLAIRLREETGLDCLMWGNDYPHTEGAFPSRRNTWRSSSRAFPRMKSSR